MIVILKPKTDDETIHSVAKQLESLGVTVQVVKGAECTILGLIGDTTRIDESEIEIHDAVEKVMHVQEPYKKANRKFHPENSIITAGGVEIGGKRLAIMAGPCSVESEEQILEVARAIKASGANFIRGGAFKPRTSPYAFQGMGLDGLELLKLARKETGLPIVTEIMSPQYVEKFAEDVDVIQVGARNMQNFDLLKELGKIRKPILLKRGLSATIEEFLMSAEYIMAGGNNDVIFCERGIRTFETYTRNTLDLSVVPALKRLSHLPVIIDPSHAAGLSWMVEPLAKAAVAVGADGLMIEVHNNPKKAKSDGPQSLTPAAFDVLMQKVRKVAEIEDREV